MDFWTIIVVFCGSLGAVGIISFFVPGLTNFLAAAFTGLFASVRQIVQFMVDMLPKPFKILLFIGLFASLGLTAYNFTYGAQFVCTDGTSSVIKVGWLEGVAYKMTATDDNVFQENQKANDLLGLNTTSPLVATGVQQLNGSDLIQTSTATYKGVSYDVSLALMPRQEKVANLGLISFFEANDADIWNNWFNNDRHIEYALCYDVVTNTCILERKNVLTGTGGCGAASWLYNDPWQGSTGTVYYYADDASKMITAQYNEAPHTLFGEIFSFGTQNGVTNRCSEISDAELSSIIADADGNALYSASATAYKTVIQGQTPKMVTLVQDDWFGGTTSFTIPVYDVDWVGIFKEATNSTVFSDAVLTLTPGGDVEDTRHCTGDTSSDCDRSKLLVDGVPVVNKPGDVVKITCDSSTKDPNDTTLKLIGVNILDPTVMISLVIFGAVISGVLYLKKVF